MFQLVSFSVPGYSSRHSQSTVSQSASAIILLAAHYRSGRCGLADQLHIYGIELILLYEAYDISPLRANLDTVLAWPMSTVSAALRWMFNQFPESPLVIFLMVKTTALHPVMKVVRGIGILLTHYL